MVTFSQVLTDAGANAASHFGYLEPPYGTDCTHLHLIGVDDASSVYNYVDPAKPLTVIGAPGYGDNYARLGNRDGFQTENQTPYSLSVLIEATVSWRPSDGVVSGGNYFSFGPASYRFVSGSEDLWRTSAGAANAGDINTDTVLSGGPPGSKGRRHYKNVFQFSAAGESGTVGRLTTEDGSALQEWSTTFTPLPVPARSPAVLKIGGDATGATIDRAFDVGIVMIYDRLLSFAEVRDVFANFITPLAEFRGLRRGAGVY